jgi:hypothetical protein
MSLWQRKRKKKDEGGKPVETVLDLSRWERDMDRMREAFFDRRMRPC